MLPENALPAFRPTGSATRDAQIEIVAVQPAGGEGVSVQGVSVPFGQALRARTVERPPQTYNVQVTAKTVAPVEKDDVLLATFYVRGLESSDETGEARMTIVFEQASDPYTKSLQLTVSAGPRWQRIDMPFKAADRYAAGQAQVNFQLGYAPQVIEFGGVSLANYKQTVQPADLPMTRFTYAGREVEAAWRSGVAARIEAVRKADLTVLVRTPSGAPVAGASAAVRQRRHGFGFGSAVAAASVVGQDADSQRYRETITRLFSKVVMENDLKWPQWEDQGQRVRTMQALAWLHEQGLPIRGHNLVWPSWRNTPKDLQGLRGDPGALRARVANHVADEAGALAGQVVDWDVINEPDANHDVMDVLGNDVMAEWFRLARQADPAARLYLNEATTPDFGPKQDRFEQTLRALIDAGAPLDGIGIQCHYAWSLTPPETLLRALDRFGQLGKTIQITEFDVDVTDEQLQADYTRDLLTAAFSHPAVDAVLTWGFWAGRHWRPDAALFRRNWAIKPNGQVWEDLVTRVWWTSAVGTTDREGLYQVRGFVGEYVVDVTRPDAAGSPKTVAAHLAPGGSTVTVVLD
jgi:GH35 family endo-1,4-beta-xylanase